MDPVVPESSDATAAPAQKYIRTYAGDIATVQRGGVPDLAPLVAPVPTPPASPAPLISPQPLPEPSEPQVGALPALDHDVLAAPAPTPHIEPHPEALLTTYEQGMREAATRTDLSSQGVPPPYVIHEDIVVPPESPPPPPPPPPLPAPLPPPPPPPAPIAPPLPPLNAPQSGALGERPSVVLAPPIADHSGLHTYGSDVTDRVEATHASRASIIATEQDAQSSRSVAPVARQDKRYVYAGIALLLLGIGGLYVAYARYIATGPVTLAPLVSTPIFVDERESVSGKGVALMTAFAQSVGRPLPAGSVRLVYNPAATSSDASIFNDLELSAPGTLLRNIDAAHSMAGVVSSGGEQTPFFILSVASYGETFAGMLSWETLMLRSLAKLYPPREALALPTEEVATSTRAPAVTRTLAAPPSRAGFVDQVVANHDTRIYRDGDGQSILIYGYWDQKTLVIARDEAAFAAIVDRLATSRTQ